MGFRGEGVGGDEGWRERGKRVGSKGRAEPDPSRGSVLKAAPSILERSEFFFFFFFFFRVGAQSVEGGGPAGQHRELHVTQLSMTTRRLRERGGRRGGAWKSSAAVRARSVGAESEEQSSQ